jgi:hypothetical protein
MLKFSFEPSYTCRGEERPFALIIGSTGDIGREISKAFNDLG